MTAFGKLIRTTAFRLTLVYLFLFAIFGWTQLSDYVRAEFLRNRSLEFVKAARA